MEEPRQRPPRRGVLVILIILVTVLLAGIDWVRPGSFLRGLTGGDDPTGVWTRDFADRLRDDGRR